MGHFDVSIVVSKRKKMKLKILFIINSSDFFVSHRLEIAQAALREGYEVHVACGDSNQKHYLYSLGIKFHHLRFDRKSTNFYHNMKIIFDICMLIKFVGPDLVHLVTIKPMLLGGIAARITNVRKIVFSISGLGSVFINKGIKSKFIQFFVSILYKLAIRPSETRIIVQNRDDLYFVANLTKYPKNQFYLIRGSGVDLKKYAYSDLPLGVPVVMFASRLLKDKGILEFVHAAKILKELKFSCRLVLVGDIDNGNPSSLDQNNLSQMIKDGTIEYWGFSNVMQETLAKATIVVLPSYREGMPKVLLEAAAIGRPVITTNVPGCRDAIIEYETGLLVEPKSADGLVKAIKILLDNKNGYLIKFGRSGRKLAEKEFDVDSVVTRHLEIYRELLLG